MAFEQRNALIAAFRREVCKVNGITLFPHQAEWQLASEGWVLVDQLPQPGQHYALVQVPDPDDDLYTEENRLQRSLVVQRLILPRPFGAAHYLVDLAGYKGGKSYGGAVWLSGFAAVPAGDSMGVQIIGSEYSTSEPEFNYLSDLLCSERGMNMRPTKYLNDRRAGRMLLHLPTGAKFEVKSWERKEALKGKKVLAYYAAEAYQLPGLEVVTSINQNLRQLRGFYALTTTPDRPWVGALHELGHGADPEWHCTCGVDSRCNVYTYDQKARDRDDPGKNGIMTRERFAIAHLGQLGHFVGRVYDVQRGSRLFSPVTHPQLWHNPEAALRSAATAVREGWK